MHGEQRIKTQKKVEVEIRREKRERMTGETENSTFSSFFFIFLHFFAELSTLKSRLLVGKKEDSGLEGLGRLLRVHTAECHL